MQISIEINTKEFRNVESLVSSQEKSASDILSEKLQSEYEEFQRGNKALADYLEPTIIALKNGEFVDQTAEEIVREVLEKISKEQQQ